jgi:superoxide dismutase, Cu-Zn family
MKLYFNTLGLLTLVPNLLSANPVSGEVNVLNPHEIKIDLQAKNKTNTKGTITLFQINDGIEISGFIENLKANSTHAIHFHQNADCSSDDAKSAGPHFNPFNKKHGKINATKEFHMGDLGNIKSNDHGKTQFKIFIKGLNMDENSKTSVLNHSIVVHKDADDFKSQPSGNAGDRIACGVIKN